MSGGTSLPRPLPPSLWKAGRTAVIIFPSPVDLRLLSQVEAFYWDVILEGILLISRGITLLGMVAQLFLEVL